MTNNQQIDLILLHLFAGPDPPEWRKYAFVAYFKDRLYYLGGNDPKTGENTNRVDVRRPNENPRNN